MNFEVNFHFGILTVFLPEVVFVQSTVDKTVGKCCAAQSDGGRAWMGRITHLMTLERAGIARRDCWKIVRSMVPAGLVGGIGLAGLRRAGYARGLQETLLPL